ncbi:hypothetical protein BAE44_0017497 [Dichanthelium oligosanthes]|uniref:Uncharacterized protein n=1 Tax=Dichanthelium oligosanthes TaxID=888268 RepID=A0A1E5V907_9POAL|nr:hypothetical protein BAE44_0017497 [Dichanthelium oligosanthes]
MTQQGADDKKEKPLCIILRCTFAGGDERAGFTGEQLRYPCKLRRHICTKCGMHRGEHNRPYAGIRDNLLPPCKRAAFRRLGEFQLQGLGGGEEEKEAALPLEEGQVWTGSAITKGKRAPRRKRADLLSCCELWSLND